jgi:hypothetical protein
MPRTTTRYGINVFPSSCVLDDPVPHRSSPLDPDRDSNPASHFFNCFGGFGGSGSA